MLESVINGPGATSDVEEREEMMLGLNAFTFQFQHLRVLLTRHEADTSACLEAARNALAILPKLISTSEQVYNGIVW
jgi:hypothetical protein